MLYTIKTAYTCLQLYIVVQVILISRFFNYMKSFMIAALTILSSVLFNGKLIIMVNDCIVHATKTEIKIYELMVCNPLRKIIN